MASVLERHRFREHLGSRFDSGIYRQSERRMFQGRRPGLQIPVEAFDSLRLCQPPLNVVSLSG